MFFTAIISILTITLIAWAVGKTTPIKICPICAGVAGTWIWLIAARFMGCAVPIEIPAILMGGSVVGIAYQLEKKIVFAPSRWRTPLVWKASFIVLGFTTVYTALNSNWLIFGAAAILALTDAALFLALTKARSANTDTVKALEDKMKDCCL